MIEDIDADLNASIYNNEVFQKGGMFGVLINLDKKPLKIIRKDETLLRRKCEEVVSFGRYLLDIAVEMHNIMHREDGVGLSAPQVGLLIKLLVVQVEGQIRTMVNPVILESSGEMTDKEGCLSFPGLFLEVTRPSYIKVKYQNVYGIERVEEFRDDLLCRAIQHEIDHLSSELFTDKANS